MKGFIILILYISSSYSSWPQGNQVKQVPPSLSHFNIDSLQKLQNQGSEEEKNIIVEFTGEPMFIAVMNSKGLNKGISADNYLSRFTQFASDLNAIRKSFGSLSGKVEIRHQFYKTFFGVSIAVPSGLLPMIQHLPYVKAMHFDKEVHAEIDPGILLIGADRVWETSGTEGEGIRIGIIDSGIDYLHPALGGGFGPGFKVAGGYDFVNNDNDPMDDYGHGTHVAGIVAADADTVKGVAPKALLYAYKVLNAEGKGSDSEILEAIERTVDPDEDGNLSDKLDIVNMSLGSDAGTPTDPACIAVNNATMLGVLFCIAAGNSGAVTPVEGKENNYFYDGSATIGSPGSAELAITVGSSDLSDQRAVFSSRGPNKISFSIKPDVLAPGVDINSTYLSSGYKVLSGTSMSTAMVTGTAALIKSLHPLWSSALIKSAIVNKAKDIGLSAYLQGGGRVRALNSVSAKTLVSPSSLGFGLDDPSISVWMKAETLYVYNKDTSTQSYTSSVAETPGGISVNLSKGSFSISPDDSLMVIVTLTVNNSEVTIEDQNILRHTGNVSFYGNIDSVSVPWAFVRTNILVVTASEPNAFFLGYSNSSAIASPDKNMVGWTSPTRAEVYAPAKGTYEFFTLFRNPAGSSKIIINEGISINNSSVNLFLDDALAVHPLVYNGVDNLGNPLSAYRAPQRALTMSLPNFGDWTTTFQGGSDTLLLSEISGSHSLKPYEFQVDLINTKTFHIVQFEKFSGMNGPKSAVNTPADFIQQHFKVKVPPGVLLVGNVIEIWSYTDAGGSGGFTGIGFDPDTIAVEGDEYTFTGYFGKSSIPSEDIAVKFYTSYSDLANFSLDYDSPYIMTYTDSVISSPRDLITPAIPRFESGATMTFGGSPASLLMLWYNNSFGANTLHFRTLFRGMLNENRNDDAINGIYSLFDKDGVKLFTKSLSDPRGPLELAADTYSVAVSSSNYWLRNARGTITQNSKFNLAEGLAAVPPSITSFVVLDGKGHTTDSFIKGEQAVFQFSVNDILFSNNVLPLFDSTKAWYRKYGTEEWIPLSLTKVAEAVNFEGLILRADLSPATTEDSVAVDLRVASKDANGFTVDQVVSPAFAVGNWDAPATDIETPPDGEIPFKFALDQNYPNPFNPSTSIRYQIPVPSRVIIKVYDILGREAAKLIDENKQPGIYSFVWNAPDFPSGVYFYRIQAGKFTETKKMVLVK
ncbi:MAG TPA: S8 family serine peptidase [Ignavibacteriaceae bacterium]|nr:S8 family serine peptidase [Ignavibacteriaceae bacterium]